MAHVQQSSLLDTQALNGLAGPRVAIVNTEWNDKIIGELTSGALRILEQHHAVITGVHTVPGAFELPFACRQLATAPVRHLPEAIIAFGAVIRGGTPHFDYVCKAVTEGITQLNVTMQVPVIFGVLTLDTELQAWERLGGVHGHKGEEAAVAALKMIAFSRSLSV